MAIPAHPPLPCSYAAIANRGVHEVVYLNTGNYPGSSLYLNETWTWLGLDWTTTSSPYATDPLGPLPLRTDFAMTNNGGNQIIMYGGRSTTNILQDTWMWNGTSWSQFNATTVPFGRYKHEMTTLTNTPVMFGGRTSTTLLNETWIFNGDWVKVNTNAPPSARTDFCMAGGTSYVVVFGGKGTFASLGDTWKFDGVSTWTQLFPTTSPSARFESCMTYDKVNNVWVMFGGGNDSGLLPAETWTFDGTNWTKKNPVTSPVARVGAHMCFDSNNNSVIMIGGHNNNQAFNETWSWDGTNWTNSFGIIS